MPEHPATAVPPPADLDLAALEREARGRIGEMAYAYYAGAAEQERLVEGNVRAWEALQLHPRVLTGVGAVSTATTLLGTPLPAPIALAPTAIQGLAHADGETATARGAAAAGALFILSSLATSPLEAVAAAAPGAPRWMQVYILRDRARTADLVARADAAGFGALVLTVDAPVSGLRLRELRGNVHLPDDLTLPNLSATGTGDAHRGGFMHVVTHDLDPGLAFEDISWLAGLSGLPVVVKGVLRADDARRCVEHGAAGIVVSNHGGRQLDDAPPTAQVLAGIVDAVGGRAEVLVDGGVRRGADVVKAVALGARAVLVGRPQLWALASGGEAGVCRLLTWLRDETARAMALCGAGCVDDIDRALLDPGGGLR